MKTKITILIAVLLLAGAIGSANAGSFSAGPSGGDRPSGPSDISDAPGGNGPSGTGDISEPPTTTSRPARAARLRRAIAARPKTSTARTARASSRIATPSSSRNCKAAGGNMPGQQGWGGKTCREPS